jgi:hypothetical protein
MLLRVEKTRSNIDRIDRSDRRRAKASQDTTSYPGDTRTILVVAVDHLPSAGDNQQQYRPRESPANHYIHGGAGDTGGTLPDVATDDRPPGRLPIR